MLGRQSIAKKRRVRESDERGPVLKKQKKGSMIKQQTQIMYDININMLSDELFDAINIIEEAMTQYPYHKHY